MDDRLVLGHALGTPPAADGVDDAGPEARPSRGVVVGVQFVAPRPMARRDRDGQFPQHGVRRRQDRRERRRRRKDIELHARLPFLDRAAERIRSRQYILERVLQGTVSYVDSL